MSIIKQWYCKKCRTVKPRADFPKFFDANTPCRACQQGQPITATHHAEGSDHRQPAPAPVRRNGKDRRED